MQLENAHLLLVEDEPLLRSMFAHWLRLAGCASVRTASNGGEALAILRHSPIDVVVSDLRMPVMDGLELLRRLGTSRRSSGWVFFLSCMTGLEQVPLKRFGVKLFLAKPFYREELIAVVGQALLTVKEPAMTAPGRPARSSVACCPIRPRERNAERESLGAFSR